jgi:hypothetical protein
MKVALIQMNSGADKPANLAAARALMERAIAEEKPDWICLPEVFDFMGGSMGSVVGERFVRGVYACVENGMPELSATRGHRVIGEFVGSGAAKIALCAAHTPSSSLYVRPPWSTSAGS